MNKRYATIWPEGEPDKAVWAQNWLHLMWLQFWVGIKTFWPNPANGKRIMYWRSDVPVNADVTAVQIANFCEDWLS